MRMFGWFLNRRRVMPMPVDKNVGLNPILVAANEASTVDLLMRRMIYDIMCAMRGPDTSIPEAVEHERPGGVKFEFTGRIRGWVFNYPSFIPGVLNKDAPKPGDAQAWRELVGAANKKRAEHGMYGPIEHYMLHAVSALDAIAFLEQWYLDKNKGGGR